MLVGLQYVGSANGISVMLYKSYKTVNVNWDKPYKFTPRDNISDDAKKYYQKNYTVLGLRLIEDTTDHVDEEVKSATPVEATPEVIEPEVKEEVTPEAKDEPEAETKVDEEVEATDAEESGEESAEAESDQTESPSLNAVVKAIVEEYGAEAIESASVGDLGEVLDSKLDENQVKELCEEVGYDYGRTRSKSKILNGLLESNLADVTKFMLS